jgi:hypothetical protein
MRFILISLKDNVSGARKRDACSLDACEGRILRIIRNNKVGLDEAD